MHSERMRKDEFSLKNLTRTFTFTPPAWAARTPLWLFALAIIALPMLIRVLMLMVDTPAPYGTLVGPADPDPWLRLSLVRDWLSGADWYDHEIIRGNAPFAGISTPWTRPLDIVIAALVKLQMGMASLDIELQRAAFLLPWIWTLLLFSGLFRAMRILNAAPVSPLITVALVGTMPVIWNYFGMGNADHHAPLCALFVWALGPLLVTPPAKSPVWISGVLLAIMLWISPEALVLIGVIYAFFGLSWIIEHPSRNRLVPLATSVAFGTLAALMIERPPAQWSIAVYDSISIVYGFILTLCALLAWALHLASPYLRTRLARILAAVNGATLLGLIVWWTFPLAFKGPMAEVDEFIHTHFLPRITEAQSLFSERPLYVIAMLIQPIAAIIICADRVKRREGIATLYQTFLLLFLVVATSALYFAQQRWYYYFYPVVVITLTPFLSALFTPEHPSVKKYFPARALTILSEQEQMKKRLPVMLAIFVMPIALLLIMPDRSTESSKRIDACQKQARILIHGGKLNDLAKDGAPLNFLVPTDLGGEMLFFTPHRIVASNYHREGTGIKYAWETEKIAEPAILRRKLAERKIEAILFCPDAVTPKDSLLLALQRSDKRPPWWLKPVTFPMDDVAKDARPAVFLVK